MSDDCQHQSYPETPYWIPEPSDPDAEPSIDWVCWYCHTYNTRMHRNCTECGMSYANTANREAWEQMSDDTAWPESPYFVSKPIDLSDTVYPALSRRDWICWYCDTYNPSVYQACNGCGAPYGLTRRNMLRNSGSTSSVRHDTIYAVWL